MTNEMLAAAEAAVNTTTPADQNKRKLVTFRTVSAINPIEGADAIELVAVDGWQVVVKKGEFKAGDPCIYFEIDSFLPDGNPAWQFLVDKQPRIFEGVKGHKLRTVRLRGQLSQGFVLPATLLPEIAYVLETDEIKAKALAETLPPEQRNIADNLRFGLYQHEAGLDPRDLDLTELLGVVKWEVALPASLQGQAKGLFPSFIQKTDQERCQNLSSAIFGYGEVRTAVGDWLDITVSQPAEGQLILCNGPSFDVGSEAEWSASLLGRVTCWKPIYIRAPKASPEDQYEITMKLDGSSGTFFVHPAFDADGNALADPEIGVCSRNLQLKISDENKENTYVRVLFDTALNVALDQYFKHTGRAIAVQGEIMGPGIQGNREGFADFKFFVFDIYDIDARKYLAPVERMAIFDALKTWAPTIDHVPVLHSAIRLKDLGISCVQDLLAHAEGPSIKHKVREGDVYKRVDGQFSFKAISNTFLMHEK